MNTYFYLNLKSLALLRVSASLIFIIDLFKRWPHIEAFYTDAGLLSRSDYSSVYQIPWKLSVFSLDGSYSFAFVIFSIGLIAGLALLIGYQTKVANFICWIMLLSLHSRHPIISHGGDNLLRMLYFWMMFLPTDYYFSVSKIKNSLLNSKNKIQNEFANIFTLAFITQICIIYIFTAIYKSHPHWFREFSALYYALNIDIFTTHLGKALSHTGLLLSLLTIGTIILESVGIFLLFIPYKQAQFRNIAVLLFVLFHFGIWITFNVGVFAPACMAAWAALLTEDFWKQLEKLKIANFYFKIETFIFSLPCIKNFEGKKDMPLVQKDLSEFKNYLGIFFITIVFLWNLEGSRIIKKLDLRSPINEVVFLLQLNQQWNMFAPSPMKNDGWYAFEGQLADGKIYDVFYDQPYSEEKPKHVGDMFINAQWQKFLLNIRESENSTHRLYFANYLCRKWNTKNENTLKHIKINFFQERTPPPNTPAKPIEKQMIWEQTCFL